MIKTHFLSQGSFFPRSISFMATFLSPPLLWSYFQLFLYTFVTCLVPSTSAAKIKSYRSCPLSPLLLCFIHWGPEVWVWVFLRAESYVYKSFSCPTFQYREPITLIRQKVMSWWRSLFYTAEQKTNMRFKGWFTPQWEEFKMDEDHVLEPTQERLSGPNRNIDYFVTLQTHRHFKPV